MATPALLSDNSTVLVVVSLRDTAENISILRLANKPGVRQFITQVASPGLVPSFDGANYALYDDRLIDSITLSSRVSFEQIGGAISGVESNGGNIDFTIGTAEPSRDVSNSLWPWLGLLWRGRTISIYQGPRESQDFADFEIIYQAMVDDFSHDLNVASIKLAGVSRLADRPLVEELYVTGAPEHLVGKPKPRVQGYVKFFAPVLYDEATQIYHISVVTGTSPILAVVENVRVGGILWEQVGTIDPNVAGQYTVDLTNGTLQLSSAPLNLEVRCDVKATGYGTLTTADLIQSWLLEKNITHDTATFAQLETDVPGFVGYATGAEFVNALNAIDEALRGAGAFRTESDSGEIRVYAIKPPAVTTDNATYDLTGINSDGIIDFKLNSILPRIYRFTMEHDRVWNPMTNFAENVPEENQKFWSSGGSRITPTDNIALRDFDPSAVAAPLIRTLFWSPYDATVVGARLASAFEVERRIYEITLMTKTNSLYSTIEVDWKMINNKMFRIIAIDKNLGEGNQVIQIWG